MATSFKKGDKVRYKKFPAGSGFAEWSGLEGTVRESDDGCTRVTVTKSAANTKKYGKADQDLSLTTRNLELIPGPQVGDTVRITEGSWEGTVGKLTRISDLGTDRAYVRILERAGGCWVAVGSEGTTRISRLEVVVEDEAEAEAVTEPESDELPREVDVSEIRAGDTVRVTYPEQEMLGLRNTDTVECTTTTRTGKVKKVSADGRELIDEGGFLINSRLNGLSKAVYTLLEREPVPEVNPMTEKGVGATFLTSHGPMGRRLLTKIAEDKWSDFFVNTQNMYTTDDRGAKDAFDTRGGDWLSVL